MSGRLFMDAVREGGAELLPIDSEHNAIFQCMSTGDSRPGGCGGARIVLTGSGGPFRARTFESLHDVTRTKRARIRTGRWAARFQSIRRR